MEKEDDWKNEFTPEELAALGEAEPKKPDDEKKPPEDGQKPPENTDDKKSPENDGKKPPADDQKPPEETHTPEEQQAAEKEGFRIDGKFLIDDEGNKIPLERWRKSYRDGKEAERQRELTQRKFELLKQKGPDEYYKLYPEEAPAGWKPKETPPAAPKALSIDDPRVLAMKITGGDYDGMTLNEVMDTDRPAALKMYANYVNNINEQRRKIDESEKTKQKEIETSVSSFGAARAKELFGLDDVTKINAEQKTKIEDIGRKVLDWQVLNNCLHYSFEHAYQLMTVDDRIKAAKEEGAKNALKGLQNGGGAPAIGGNKGPAGGENNGWDAMAKWGPDEMSAHIDKLSEKDYSKFLKEAPASIKAKFKNIPW